MQALGLGKNFAITFLKKHSSIAGLDQTDEDTVIKHIDSVFN